MKITLIVAADLSGAIGVNNSLPWRIPSDLKRFKDYTSGKLLVCGRKTFLSLPGLLANRDMLVMSSNDNVISEMQLRADAFKSKNPNQQLPFCGIVNSMTHFIEVYEEYFKHQEEVCVIGGSEIYELFYPYADKILLTVVNTNVPNADTFFERPNKEYWRNKLTIVKNVSSINDDHSYSVYELVRKQSAAIFYIKSKEKLSVIDLIKVDNNEGILNK